MSNQRILSPLSQKPIGTKFSLNTTPVQKKVSAKPRPKSSGSTNTTVSKTRVHKPRSSVISFSGSNAQSVSFHQPPSLLVPKLALPTKAKKSNQSRTFQQAFAKTAANASRCQSNLSANNKSNQSTGTVVNLKRTVFSPKA
jgi:hypothetical protein